VRITTVRVLPRQRSAVASRLTVAISVHTLPQLIGHCIENTEKSVSLPSAINSNVTSTLNVQQDSVNGIDNVETSVSWSYIADADTGTTNANSIISDSNKHLSFLFFILYPPWYEIFGVTDTLCKMKIVILVAS